MTNFMSSDNDSTESAGVLDDGNTVDLLQALVNDTSSSDVREAFNFELSPISLSPPKSNKSKSFGEIHLPQLSNGENYPI
jgi:hypothetical protein